MWALLRVELGGIGTFLEGNLGRLATRLPGEVCSLVGLR